MGQVGFSDDQEQFAQVVNRFLASKSPTSEVRRLMADDIGYDEQVWSQLSSELGVMGTHLPEVYGGFGFGPVELGIVCQEMGRHLYCGPYFSTAVMSAYALLFLSDEAPKESLLPEVAAGTTKMTLVLDNLDDVNQVGTTLQVDNQVLSGTAEIVLDAHTADRLLVIAQSPGGSSDGLGLYLCEPQAAHITSVTAMDLTRKLSRVSFDQAPVEKLGQISRGALHTLWDHINVALAHEMIGGAQQLFESTIDYMKMRVQFGRAIGSFQALKHRCADLLMELELAKAMTHASARYLAQGGEEGEAYSPNLAKAMASDAYVNIAKQAIQLRGGIGFTWEEDTHLWFKRAKSSEVFLGSAAAHRELAIQKIEGVSHE